MSFRTKQILAISFLVLLVGAVHLSVDPGTPFTKVVPVDPGPMRARHVDMGDHAFSPGYGLGFAKRSPGWTMRFTVDSMDWYNPGLLGKDGKDWSKIGGVNYFSLWRPSTWPNNRRAAMGAFRMGDRNGTFEVTGYTNLNDGSHDSGQAIPIAGGDTVRIDYDYYNGKAVFEVWVNDTGYHQMLLDIDVERLQIYIPPWHGGQKRAPQDFKIFSSLKSK